MPFRQPEYERAFTELLSRTIDALIAADPLLGKVQRRPTSGPVALAPSDEQVGQEQLLEVTSGTLDGDALLRVDVPAVRVWLDGTAEAYVDHMRDSVFEAMQRAAEQSGQLLGTPGAPISWDMLLEGFERIDWPEDEHGSVREPDVVLRPPRTLEELAPRTPEQERRLEAIRARKQEEHDARRRNRRLS